MRVLLVAFFLLSFLKGDLLEVDILYLEQKVKQPPVLSNVIERPDDLGLRGAEIAINDSRKSSKFLNQKFNIQKAISYDEKELIESFENFIKMGNSYVVLNVETPLLKTLINHPENRKALFINANNKESALRKEICRENLLHTIPSNAMLYDGLMQFLVKRDFKDLFLIYGNNKKDLEISQEVQRSAKKFGAKIVKEKQWKNSRDIRRKANAEFPSFTQGGEYDIVVVADYYGDFGEFLYFNTWLPRPIAGTQGLRPLLWHKVIEQWGAAQMQNRFEEYAKRWMESEDFANWIAFRGVISAVTQTRTKALGKNLSYIRSKDFEIGAYMGRKVSFREYNGQLRTPISLVQPRALISTSPQVGFLHPTTDLDTLGIAPFEMRCKK